MTILEFNALLKKLRSLPSLREDTCVNSGRVMKTVLYQGQNHLVPAAPDSIHYKTLFVGYHLDKENPKVKEIVNGDFVNNSVIFDSGGIFLFHNLLGPALTIFKKGYLEELLLIHGEPASLQMIKQEQKKEQNKKSLKKKLSAL